MNTNGKKAIFCDFDGTIIEQDIGRIMVPQLAPEWWSRVREIYPLVTSGQMGSRSWYYWKFLQAKINANEYVDLVHSVNVTPGFTEFYALLRETNYEFVILSDGFDSYIRLVLERLGMSEQVVYCNTMELGNNDRPRIEFLHHNERCGFCGMCKAGVITSYVRRGYEALYIGDGVTDIYAAEASHGVFATDSLAKLCEQEGIPFTPFKDFWDIIDSYKGDFDVKRKTPSLHQRCNSLQNQDVVLSKVEL